METPKYILIEEETFNGIIAAAGAGVMTAEDDETRLKFIGQVAILMNNIKKLHLKTKEEALEILNQENTAE
ncbi:hypothetical protein ACFFGT_03100 [Mucilaginibacter angelicae]|uniref:Uncharacterized protein n=1 Tax=Mucilaginibacter angelicae TaxID=869718 RepID=A0ABV6L0A7_9SPHI